MFSNEELNEEKLEEEESVPTKRISILGQKLYHTRLKEEKKAPKLVDVIFAPKIVF